jgi:hypothetical protein
MANKGSYPIREGGRPAGSPSGYGGSGDIDTIRRLIGSTDPGSVAAAGQAYDQAAGRLGEVQNSLFRAAQMLAEQWRGEAAEGGLAALRQLFGTAAELTRRTQQAGQALGWYGGQILPWYKAHLPGKGWISDGGDDEYAREFMARLNDRIAQTWDGMPAQVDKDLPGLDRRASEGAGPGGWSSARMAYQTDSSAGRTLDADDGSGASGAASQGSAAPTAGGSGVSGIDVPDGADMDLAGLTGPGGVPGRAGPGGGLGFQDPFGPGGLGVPGGGSAGLGAGFVVGGPGGGRLSGPGSSPRLAGGPGTGPGASDRGGALVPGAGGGTGRDERERRRDSWLADERDVWAPDSSVVPPVVGDAPPRGVRDEDDDAADAIWSDAEPDFGDDYGEHIDADLDDAVDDDVLTEMAKLAGVEQVEEERDDALAEPAAGDDGDGLDDVWDGGAAGERGP